MEGYVGNLFPVRVTDNRDHATFQTCSPPNEKNLGCPMYATCRLPTKGQHVADECDAECDGRPHPVHVLVADRLRRDIRAFHCAQWYAQIKDDHERYGERIPYSAVAEKGIAHKINRVSGSGRDRVSTEEIVYAPPPREAILGDEANDSYEGLLTKRSPQSDLVALSLGHSASKARDASEFGPRSTEAPSVGGAPVITTKTTGQKMSPRDFLESKR